MLVGQVELTLCGLKGHPWLLGHKLEVHGLVGLQPDNQLISLCLSIEDVSRDVTKLNTNLSLALI